MKAQAKRLIVLLLALCFLGTGCSSGNENVPEEYKALFKNGSFDENYIWTGNDEKYSELIEELKACCEESATGSVMLATDDEVIFAGGFNALEIDGETTVNPFTTYEIGSVTKQFMAAAILQLVKEGKLQTSDTIDKFFPEYSYGSKITIDNLLHMDSGIPDYVHESMKFWPGRTAEEYEAFMNGQMSDEEILEYLYKTELNFEPGEKYRYSNTNYYLLAIILEQVSGKTYEEYLQQHIFDVCGLKNTTCTEIGNVTSVPQGNAEYNALSRACRGAADMCSNVCDILLWNRALMNGKILDETQFNYMTELRNGYACGWMDMGNDAIIGHTGETWGYTAVNSIYQADGKKFYLIQMTPTLSDKEVNNMLKDIPEIVEKYLVESKK